MVTKKFSFREITREKYTELLEKTKHYTFYNSTERFNFLESQQRALRFFAVERNEKIIGLLHYQIVTTKTGRMLYFQHAPILNKTYKDNYIFKLFRALKRFALTQLVENNVAYARFTVRVKRSYRLLKKLYEIGYRRAPIHEIDSCVTRTINVPLFDIKNIRKTTRNSINQGLRFEMETNGETSPQNFNEFLKLYNEMEELKGFSPLPNSYMASELAHYRDNKMLKQYLTYKDNELVSGAIVILFKGTAYYYHAATTLKGRNLQASYVTLYRIIEDLKLNHPDIKTLDLWGGSLTQKTLDKQIKHPWESLDVFKRGFTDELMEFLPPMDLPRSNLHYLIPYWSQFLRSKRRGYPIVD
jgi:lipid II:glycine glycyltransferase (peptidoglycan interpeptide bridge formation enzyme)